MVLLIIKDQKQFFKKNILILPSDLVQLIRILKTNSYKRNEIFSIRFFGNIVLCLTFILIKILFKLRKILLFENKNKKSDFNMNHIIFFREIINNIVVFYR